MFYTQKSNARVFKENVNGNNHHIRLKQKRREHLDIREQFIVMSLVLVLYNVTGKASLSFKGKFVSFV